MKRLISVLCIGLLCMACTQEPKADDGMEQVLTMLEEGRMQEAEQAAYEAIMAGRDSVEVEQAMSMLCFVYIMEGKDAKAQVLMSTLPAQRTMKMIRLHEQTGRHRQAQLQLWFLGVVVVLLAVLGALGWRYYQRRSLFAERIARVNGELEDLKERLMKAELNTSQQTAAPSADKPQLSQLHTGIDVLHRIVEGRNISQCGKGEQTAVVTTLQSVDPSLAALLQQASQPLTPKETFFCIMEHYGMSDAEKARSFCCSEQAVRSTKSRLGKKLDLSIL